jgi:Transcriptional regulatory protein, C terminal/Protein of unknown function (DUF1153)
LGYPIVRDFRGELITPNMLPSMDVRWTPRRREIAALALRHGLISAEQASARWCMTIEELHEWGAVKRRKRNGGAAEPPRVPVTFSGAIRVGAATVQLNKTDYLIFQLFEQRQGKVVTHRMIATLLYGRYAKVKSRVIDVFIVRLRKRLQESGAAVKIETVWGRGFLLQPSKFLAKGEAA